MRNGADARLPTDMQNPSASTHKEMLLQIARDYAGLPDPRTLSAAEIVFFYEGLRPELKKHTHGR